MWTNKLWIHLINFSGTCKTTEHTFRTKRKEIFRRLSTRFNRDCIKRAFKSSQLSYEINIKESKENKNDKVLKQLFECPICKDYMIPPIHQCVAGHTLCNVCKTKVSFLLNEILNGAYFIINFLNLKMGQFFLFPTFIPRQSIILHCAGLLQIFFNKQAWKYLKAKTKKRRSVATNIRRPKRIYACQAFSSAVPYIKTLFVSSMIINCMVKTHLFKWSIKNIQI